MKKNIQLIRASSTNGSHGRLVVLQDQICIHIMRLIHQPKDHVRVALEASSKLAPECTELYCGSSCGISCVPYNRTRAGLLGGVVVPHVVVRIEECVGALCDSDVVYGVSKVVIVLLGERVSLELLRIEFGRVGNEEDNSLQFH